jgi:hypothetical protein
MDTISEHIDTMSGVTAVSEPAGTVSVERGYGDTVTALTTRDNQGNEATVYLDYTQGIRLMTALGAALNGN